MQAILVIEGVIMRCMPCRWMEGYLEGELFGGMSVTVLEYNV